MPSEVMVVWRTTSEYGNATSIAPLCLFARGERTLQSLPLEPPPGKMYVEKVAERAQRRSAGPGRVGRRRRACGGSAAEPQERSAC